MLEKSQPQPRGNEPAYTTAEIQEVLTGRAGSFRMTYDHMVEDAMNTVRALGRRSPIDYVRVESQWWALVFEEAMLAVEDYIKEHGRIPWQPRFIVDPSKCRTKAGHLVDCDSRRHDRLEDFDKVCRMLAAKESPPPAA